MKVVTNVLLFLLLIGSSCTKKKCPPPDFSFNLGTCVYDSAELIGLLPGTWNRVFVRYPSYRYWQCEVGGEITYSFSTTGIYQYRNNGVILHQGNYALQGTTLADTQDSSSLYTRLYYCQGYLILSHDTVISDIYFKD
jgi:hypothetical protein